MKGIPAQEGGRSGAMFGILSVYLLLGRLRINKIHIKTQCGKGACSINICSGKFFRMDIMKNRYRIR
jgi:hypothetical protein